MAERSPPDEHQDAPQKNRASENKTPALEWIAAALGLILLVGSLGPILYDAFDQDTPPRLEAQAGPVVSVGSRYLVQVTVWNHGGSTTAAVNVEGTLKQNGKTIETASTTFDYVPAHSSTKGGMFFTHNPRAYRIQLEANAYMEP